MTAAGIEHSKLWLLLRSHRWNVRGDVDMSQSEVRSQTARRNMDMERRYDGAVKWIRRKHHVAFVELTNLLLLYGRAMREVRLK